MESEARRGLVNKLVHRIQSDYPHAKLTVDRNRGRYPPPIDGRYRADVYAEVDGGVVLGEAKLTENFGYPNTRAKIRSFMKFVTDTQGAKFYLAVPDTGVSIVRRELGKMDRNWSKYTQIVH